MEVVAAEPFPRMFSMPHPLSFYRRNVRPHSETEKRTNWNIHFMKSIRGSSRDDRSFRRDEVLSRRSGEGKFLEGVFQTLEAS
jgi:hypothetical protein